MKYVVYICQNTLSGKQKSQLSARPGPDLDPVLQAWAATQTVGKKQNARYRCNRGRKRTRAQTG